MSTVSATPNGASKNSLPALDTYLARLEEAIATLRADVDRLTKRVYTVNDDVEFKKIRVVGETGVVEIGQLAPNYFGVRVTGRGTCTGLMADLGLDDGEHSLPCVPNAYVDVEGRSGYVRSAVSSLPMEPPSTVWETSFGDRSVMSFRHGGFADGFYDAPADVRGAWYGQLEIADGYDSGPGAVIEVSILDDVARCCQFRHDDKWDRSSD